MHEFECASEDHTRLCARSWLSGNLGKTALRLLEIMPMYYDTSLKTSRIDLTALFSPRSLSRNGNFFFSFKDLGEREMDGIDGTHKDTEDTTLVQIEELERTIRALQFVTNCRR